MTSVMGNSTQLRKSLRVSVHTFSDAHPPIEKQRLLHVRESVTVGGATGMVTTSGSFRRRLIACHNGRNNGRPTRARQAAREEGGDRRES